MTVVIEVSRHITEQNNAQEVAIPSCFQCFTYSGFQLVTAEK